jgi:hypothetical protein
MRKITAVTPSVSIETSKIDCAAVERGANRLAG